MLQDWMFGPFEKPKHVNPAIDQEGLVLANDATKG